MIPESVQRGFYAEICTKKEIDRIFNVRTASDYLLKLRADTILDHMRLYRVYRNKARETSEWSLEKSFDSSHFEYFMDRLPDELKRKCEVVTYGNIFTNEPNGLIFKTEYGPITTISDSLEYFLEFMNLGILDDGINIPIHVKFNAIRIAIRVMLEKEALDFHMDPRGIIPDQVKIGINYHIPFQLQFIAGHEYSHFLLGHINEHSSTKNQNIFTKVLRSHTDYKAQTVYYNVDQKSEFDADLAAIELPLYSPNERQSVFIGALLWFASLDIYEAVKHSISPPMGHQSHPPARDRYFKLLDKVKIEANFNKRFWYDDVPKLVNVLKDMLIEDVALNIENYETYGSVYLDAPNTQWRGKELIDRVDFY